TGARSNDAPLTTGGSPCAEGEGGGHLLRGRGDGGASERVLPGGPRQRAPRAGPPRRTDEAVPDPHQPRSPRYGRGLGLRPEPRADRLPAEVAAAAPSRRGDLDPSGDPPRPATLTGAAHGPTEGTWRRSARTRSGPASSGFRDGGRRATPSPRSS